MTSTTTTRTGYRIGGARNNSSYSPSASYNPGIASPSSATTTAAAASNENQNQTSPATSQHQQQQSPNNNNNNNNPIFSSTSRRPTSNKSGRFKKEGSDVSRTLSFEPTTLLARRKQMCARRGELGAEKVICSGRSALDDDNDEAEYQYKTEMRSNLIAALAASPVGKNNRQTPSGGGATPTFAPTENDTRKNMQTALLSNLDAPSPLNRFFGSPVLNNNNSKSPHHQRGGGGGRRTRTSSDEFFTSTNSKQNTNNSKRSVLRDGDYDVYDDDDQFNEENDEEEEEEEEPVVHMELPDWKTLLGKEFYSKEQDKMEIIKDRYSVATNPEGENNKKRGRRRSVAGRGVLESSMRK